MRLLQVSEVHGGVAGSGWTGSSSPESSKGSVMGGSMTWSSVMEGSVVWSSVAALFWGQSVDALMKTQKQQMKLSCIQY